MNRSSSKNTTQEKVNITPETKIGILLQDYPQLEHVLLEISPAFKKLRNPLLRKTIGRVASLRQVAEIGRVSLGNLINHLRQAVGQGEWTDQNQAEASAVDQRPAWVDLQKVVKTLDARPLLEAGEHPVGQVMQELETLATDQLFVLITPFIPSPLIDLAKNKGYRAWTVQEGEELFRTYFSR
ncbi:MAG: hypothetical protein Kow0042_13330 [Calditrichia bacterium]